MRRLAYASTPGTWWPEDSWVRARQHTQGLSEAAAKGEIEAEITAKRIVVVEEAK